ncbi:MAG: electron transport complex subunit E [Firmicutes bacterium]|nr:electron transport complex subunit E [Dethiobacter sp.]MBS3888928.1 electron transport complex subunit E [Bacillota bacterium]MBS4053548.1 electron transport complex subunit E [Thermaerobacter sp.]
MSSLRVFFRGLLDENPVLRLLLGMCPTLAVSTAALNGLGMGLAATAVLVASNILISLLRPVIPDKIRIPCYIVVIATFVTMVDLLMEAFVPGLHGVLGIFIPLIVVNCIILQRAEAFASKNGVFLSAIDGIGMGLGFTVALLILASVREVMGAGTFFGLALLPATFEPMKLMVSPPGAFIGLGLIIGLINYVQNQREVRRRA